MKKVKSLFIVTPAIALVPAFFTPLFAGASADSMVSVRGFGAVECSVLPSSICSKAEDGSTNGGVFQLLKWVLMILTTLVGIGAVGGLIWAGIMYGTAGGDTNKVKQSKTIITDTIIGIIAYGLMIVVINWLVPGGVF